MVRPRRIVQRWIAPSTDVHLPCALVATDRPSAAMGSTQIAAAPTVYPLRPPRTARHMQAATVSARDRRTGSAKCELRGMKARQRTHSLSAIRPVGKQPLEQTEAPPQPPASSQWRLIGRDGHFRLLGFRTFRTSRPKRHGRSERGAGLTRRAPATQDPPALTATPRGRQAAATRCRALLSKTSAISSVPIGAGCPPAEPRTQTAAPAARPAA